MSDEEQNVPNEGENTVTETVPAPPTETIDSNEKTTDETKTSKRRLLSNKMIVIVAAVALVSLIIIIIIIVVFFVMNDSKSSKGSKDPKDVIKFAAKAKAKCEEYAQLACTEESGKPKLSDSGRIVNGRDASPDIVPYMAYIIVLNIIDVNECTGTLISERFVLTAAHCFKKRDPDKLVLGYLASVPKLSPGKLTPPTFTSSKIYIHDMYNKSNMEGDIALIKTLKKINLNASVRPICLNTKLENTAGDFISAGYGLIEGDKDSDRLKMVEIRMDGEVQKKCKKEIESGYDYEVFTSKMICAAHPTERKGGSLGDSGGPLMYLLKHKCPNVHEQIGVLSKSRNYTQNDPPVLLLYAKVEYYIEWIVKIVWPDKSAPK